MTDADLRSRLADLRPPAPTAPAASRALFRAQLAHAHATRATPDSTAENLPLAPASRLRRFLPSLSLLAPAALAILLLLPIFRAAPAPRAKNAAAADLAVLAQLQQLFPGQLDAIIDRDGTLQLELSDKPAQVAPPADQALLLELTRGARRLRVLAYSGRPVRLRLDHHELRFSPLLTGSGQVMLAGDDFAWSPSADTPPRALAGWQIHAHPLGAVL